MLIKEKYFWYIYLQLKIILKERKKDLYFPVIFCRKEFYRKMKATLECQFLRNISLLLL